MRTHDYPKGVTGYLVPKQGKASPFYQPLHPTPPSLVGVMLPTHALTYHFNLKIFQQLILT